MYHTKIKNTKIDSQVVFDPGLTRKPAQMPLTWAACLRNQNRNGSGSVWSENLNILKGKNKGATPKKDLLFFSLLQTAAS